MYFSTILTTAARNQDVYMMTRGREVLIHADSLMNIKTRVY